MTSIDLTNFKEIRQHFVMPPGYIRGENTIPRDPVVTPLTPDVIGFGFLVEVEKITDPNFTNGLSGDDSYATNAVSFAWEFWDEAAGAQLRNGIHTGAVSTGQCWIDVFFESTAPVLTSPASRFSFRIQRPSTPLALSAFHTAYTQSPSPQGNSPDTDVFTLDLNAVLAEVANNSLVYRIWADVADEGQDLLGNNYREGVRRDAAANVNDAETLTSWVSKPNPASTGVERLYFDVRKINPDSRRVPVILDSIRVNPFVTGTYMHVYVSTEGVNDPSCNPPQTLDEWDSVLWQPVHQTYILTKNEILSLPRGVRAAWLKLEFSNLQPLPYQFPSYPPLPAVLYDEMPQSVLDLRTQFDPRTPSSGDHFIQDQTIVNVDVFEQLQPNTSFIFPDRILPTDFTDPVQTGSNVFTDINNNPTGDIKDPITMALIHYNTAQLAYSSVLQTGVNTTDSLLGAVVNQRANDLLTQFPTEVPRPRTRTSNAVSSLADRTKDIATAFPYYWSQTARHAYRQVKARFNGKAYFAGIREVEFIRRDFTVTRDDPLYSDILADPSVTDSPLILINTWIQQPASGIPLGQPAYLTYDIGEVTYVDDFITGITYNPSPLTYGGARAVNVQVWSGPNKTGTQYVPTVDYDIIYDPESFNNSIVRNGLHYRLTAV